MKFLEITKILFMNAKVIGRGMQNSTIGKIFICEILEKQFAKIYSTKISGMQYAIKGVTRSLVAHTNEQD